MDSGSSGPIGVAPFHSRGALKGFVISGRWPDSTKEWAQLLMVAVRVASLPGLLSTTTVFGAREELPDEPEPGTVGLVLAEGTVFGESAIQPGCFGDHQPPALLMLHPPSETTPSLPECTGAASGCVLLPGLPYLGLEHRAAWVEAEADGTITSMVSRVGVDPIVRVQRPRRLHTMELRPELSAPAVEEARLSAVREQILQIAGLLESGESADDEIAAFNEAVRKYRDASRGEPGFVAIEVFGQGDRPGHFVVLETWKDQAASDAHAKSAAVTQFRSALDPIRWISLWSCATSEVMAFWSEVDSEPFLY